MRKGFGAKISHKFVKSEPKIRQKLVESGAKIRLFRSVFGAQRYKNGSDNFSFFSIHSISQAQAIRLKLNLRYAANCENGISKIVFQVNIINSLFFKIILSKYFKLRCLSSWIISKLQLPNCLIFSSDLTNFCLIFAPDSTNFCLIFSSALINFLLIFYQTLINFLQQKSFRIRPIILFIF